MAPSPPRSRGWDEVLRRLLPAGFRAGWSGEILELLRAEQAAARRRGRLALMRFRARTVVDVARAGWQMRPGRGAGWRYDLRLALRSLRRSPGFLLAAVLTLGLGIAVSAGMFSALEHTLVRPLPVRDPSELLQLRTFLPPDADPYGLSGVDLTALEQGAGSLSAITYHLPPRLDADILLRTEAGLERVDGLHIGRNYFHVLGVAPLIGPGFDTSAEAPPEVMLSYALWSERYGRDTEVVGRSVNIDHRSHQIVGVLPAGFDLPYEGRLPDYWVPRPVLPAERDYADGAYFEVTARRTAGATTAEAVAEIEAIGERIAAERPGSLAHRRLTAVPLAETVVQGWTAPLTLLGVASLVVLLMACSSVALLMLARQTGRARELALWMALGAGRVSVLRRVLLEVVSIAGLGMLLGMLLARWGTAALLALVPSSVPRFDGVTLDTNLLAFAVAALGLTTLLGGVAPLLQLRRLDPASSLKGTAPAAAGDGGSWMRSGIVALQSALMAAMLVVLGLALVSFARLRAVDPGFEAAARYAVQVTAPQSAGGPGADQQPRETAFFAELRERALGLPGIRTAGIVSNLPLTQGWGGVLFEEGAPDPESEAPMIDWEVAGPGYFEAAGIPLVRGRGFEPGDTADAPFVVIINETFAERFFPDRDPLGLSISGESRDGPWRRVVGIVGDVRQQGLDAPAEPQMYIAQAQGYPFGKYQLVLSGAPGTSVDAATTRALVRSIDGDAVSGAVQPLAELVHASVAPMRLAMTLVALFSGLATLLAVTGTWGVISIVGRSRSREWGVRTALGAERGQIVAAATRVGAPPVLAGLTIGFLAAALATRWLASYVYGLSAWEPGVFAGVLLVLALVTGAVVVVPAWRTSRVDPAIVFRET